VGLVRMFNKSKLDKSITKEEIDLLGADHGSLAGLDDDDHLQYHTDGRGDIRYYTQAQVDVQAIKWAMVFGD